MFPAVQKRNRRHPAKLPALLACLGLATTALGGCGVPKPVEQPPPACPDRAASTFNVLVFSRTAVFRHESIPDAVAALQSLQAVGGYQAAATENPQAFTPEGLSCYQVVVFLLTTGDVLNDVQQTAFEAWIDAGGGYVGIHSAADTEYDWPFYGELVGAYFLQHPAVQQASVDIEATDHPVVQAAGLPSPWVDTDEWYDFRTNPRPRVTVLATVDESTYSGGVMGADHPITWVHATPGGGRAFYTALGHTKARYADPLFRRFLVAALRWAAGL